MNKKETDFLNVLQILKCFAHINEKIRSNEYVTCDSFNLVCDNFGRSGESLNRMKNALGYP